MKKIKARGFRYLVAVSLICLLLGLAPSAHAGYPPDPYVGKLGAVANNPESINDRINMVLGLPIDP
jgi:hypothetical protein